jgi:hypothetical protein
LPVLPGEQALLGFAQPVARVQEQVDLSPCLPGELVDRPRRDGRLPQALDLLRLLAVAGLTQLASEPVALGDERAGLERVEAIELCLEVVYAVPPPSGSAWPSLESGRGQGLGAGARRARSIEFPAQLILAITARET